MGGDLPMEEHTQAQNGGQLMCIPPPGAGGGCLLGALNKGVPRLSIHMAHTHTQENMLAMQCKYIN